VPLGIGKLFPELSGSILTLLPPSPTTALPLLLLSLASRPKHSLVILPSPHLLRTALTSASHPTPGLLVIHESVVDGLAVEALGRASVLIVGDPNQEHKAFAERAAKSGIAVKWWEQIWDAGETATDVPDTTGRCVFDLQADLESSRTSTRTFTPRTAPSQRSRT